MLLMLSIIAMLFFIRQNHEQAFALSYLLLSGLLTCWISCTSSTNKCTVRHEATDCSHLKLTQIPDDLPTNITVLNLTHNQLRRLPACQFYKIQPTYYLGWGFNSISKLEPELCPKSPLVGNFEPPTQ